MSFFTTEALPVLDRMCFNGLGGAVGWNEVPKEDNFEIRWLWVNDSVITSANDIKKKLAYY